MTKNAKVSIDKGFGDKIEFSFPARSYQKRTSRFSLYVTGMDEVSAHVEGDVIGGKYVSWFFSADDLLVLREWLDEHIVPAKAKVTSSFSENLTETKITTSENEKCCEHCHNQ